MKILKKTFKLLFYFVELELVKTNVSPLRSKIYFLLLIISSFLISKNGYSQDPPIIPKTKDSLAVFLKNYPQKDTVFIRAIRPYALKLIYEDANYKKADSLANVQNALSEKINYGRGIYFSYLIKAIIGNDKNQSVEALGNFKKCLETVNKYKISPSLVEASLNNIAVAFEDLGERDSALVYAMNAIKVQEENIKLIKKPDSGPYIMVSNIFKFDKKYDKAIEYSQKGLDLAKQFGDKKGITIIENKIGNIYDLKGDTKEALKHYQLALKLANEEGYQLLQTDVLSNIGRLYHQLKDFKKSEEYLNQNLAICKNLESPGALNTAYLELGSLFQDQKKYTLAEKYFQSANALFPKLQDLEDKKEAVSQLADFYKTTGDYKKAFDFLYLEKQYADSLSAQDSEKLRLDLISKYESDKKEQQIKALEDDKRNATFRQNAWIFGGILAFIAAGLTFAFVISRNKLKELEASQKLRNQIAIDLHDEIGSTLSSISILSEMVAHEQKLGKIKPETMLQVSKDARVVIDKMDDIIWTINPQNDGFNNLETRLKAFAIPMFESKNINFEFDFSKEIEASQIEMSKRRDIYLIMKEAINNLIKYSECQNAKISGEVKKGLLVFEVADDGKGFNTDELSLRNGLKNMKKRATNIGGKLNILSDSEKGTIISLEISG